MFELMFCSLLTIFPDYLYRRFAQGKRIGKEITIFSVWFELRWGIVGCLLLTLGLITVVFYYHPSTRSVTSFFRTVPIISEANGRVAEIFIGVSDQVVKGAPIFRLDSSRQEAEAELARRRIIEVDASILVAQADLTSAEGAIREAQAVYKQALDELQTKQELNKRNSDVVSRREIERLDVLAKGRQAGVDSAIAARDGIQAKLSSLLPAERASAEAALAQAEVEINKTVVRAGVTGRVEQFALQVGDIVNPFMRSAGILIPEESGRSRLQAGFGQIEAQIMKPGMIAEATCVSKPWVIIPMVVVEVQDYIAAGQFRGGEQLVEAQNVTQPGTVLVKLEPLFEGGLEGVIPGSSCIANAYTSNHEALRSKDLGTFARVGMHVVDTVGLVHALILRIQALLLPIQILVLGGH